MIKAEKEKTLERKLVKLIKKFGGMCFKMPAVHFTGLPDRMCLLPGGRVYFVEVKETGKNLSPRQAVVHRQFAKLGFDVRTIESTLGLEMLAEDIALTQ